MKHLITLSSPIAIRNGDGQTKMVNVVEATKQQLSAGEVMLNIHRYFNSTTQQMCEAQAISVHVKASNLRSQQEVQ